MANPGSGTRNARAAAAVLAVVIVVLVVLTFLSYTAAFTPTDSVTVTSPRAGLVMDKDAKVKYRGIQVGRVKDIEYAADQARLTLLLNRDQIRYIPSNADVRIASNTIFGAKSVEFIPPQKPSGTPLQPGTHKEALGVQLEVNTLFQTLTDLLEKINPIELNATLSAVSEGLRGHGDDFGATAVGLNEFLPKINPKMPTLHSDLRQAAAVGNVYGDAAPDIVALLDNAPAISNTIVDERDNLNATLLAATGLADNGTATLEPVQEDLIAAFQRVRAPLKVLSDYSPELGCIFKGVKEAVDKFGPVIGGTRPGLFVSSSFVPGTPIYRYPENLPIVNATGGPNCRGLPNMPSMQFGGSWFRAPFLVTDNAYIPYEPFTEVQIDAPSTFQFLFNGAFAERDDW
jgi:phospholipid/cholesterol/gamma-HCH transport system substrate-binding protein